MIWTIASFELRKRLQMLSTYVYFAVFLICGALTMLAAGGAFSNVSVGAGSEKVHANAPVLIAGVISVLTNLGVLVSAAVFGQAVHQDYENDAGLVLFTLPIKKSSYLVGRFLGALLFTLFIFSSIALGQLLVSVSPVFVERELFGPVRVSAYLWPYVSVVLPNLLFTGGLFFALATLTRKMMPVYVGAVLVGLGYLMASSLLSDIENKNISAMIDPLGVAATALLTRYWTVADKNTLLVPLSGQLLLNRLLWMGIGLGILGFTYVRFQFGVARSSDKPRATGDDEPAPLGGALPTPTLERSPALVYARLTALGLRETIKNVYFGIFALAGGILTLTVTSQVGRLYGTPTYPVTGIVSESVDAGFTLFMLTIITFYAGEIVWRERDLRFDQITDALPLPTWVPYAAKLTALCLAPALLLIAVMSFGIGYQLFEGYHHLELGLYVRFLWGVALPAYLYLCVLAVVVQSVVVNKYLGHFVMIAFYVFQLFQDRLGLEHRLLKYGDTPPVTYSDMNGFGHFLRPLGWYDLYWAGAALVVAVVGNLFWTRGVEASARTRLGIARARFAGGVLPLTALGLCIAGAAGGVIFYNSDVLNHYRSSHHREERRATFEKTHKTFEKVPQPRVIDVKVDLDVYPEEEALHAHGVYQLQNKNAVPVTTVYLNTPDDQVFKVLTVGGQAATASEVSSGWYTFTLPEPMPPGATLPLEFDVRLQDRGFKMRGNRTDLAENGTFVNNGSFPHVGYDRNDELEEDNDRKKYGLAPRDRLPDLNDPVGLGRNLITSDADWVGFEATVSTSADQIAVVPGYLDREWTQGNRRFFHYKMDSKILDFYSVLSARYQVLKDKWNDVDLEIYYHPGHEYDLGEMMEGMKLALAYDSENFGPYQHRQARILEFPRYQQFAQSFPNTIPYSEAIGFIAKVNHAKDDDVDYPLYVTAHEISHQWWAHQVIGGDVQGVTLLDETLAQYSALMVMKKRFGPNQMRRFLKYELDRYLMGRSTERKREVPLMRVENQPYIHYNKGSVVMYALQDYIGEDRVNQALRAFLDAWKFKGPPYPNATNLLDELRKVTPPEMQYLIHDLFETITLYDNRAVSATAVALPGGKYKVTVKISAKKLQADEQGKETEVPMDDLVDVGALDSKNLPLTLERRRIKGGDSEVDFVTDQLPAKAGIDPLDKLIDRHPDDNTIAVTTSAAVGGS